MSEGRVEMLSLEKTLELTRELGLHEPQARLNVFRTLFRRPKTAKAISDLLLSLLFEAELDHRTRELVIMRIGWVTGCDYEWTQHWPIAQQIFGCTREELLALRDWRSAEVFDDRDRAALEATDELLDAGDLSDATWARCESLLGTEASVDLVASIATWQLISKIARGLRIPLEDGVDSWPPDGRPSPAEGEAAG